MTDVCSVTEYQFEKDRHHWKYFMRLWSKKHLKLLRNDVQHLYQREPKIPQHILLHRTHCSLLHSITISSLMYHKSHQLHHSTHKFHPSSHQHRHGFLNVRGHYSCCRCKKKVHVQVTRVLLLPASSLDEVNGMVSEQVV